MSIEAMKLALETLRVVRFCVPPAQRLTVEKATTALRQAIEQAEQQVTSLQCAHCQVTIDTLNDKVMYLMEQAQKQEPKGEIMSIESINYLKSITTAFGPDDGIELNQETWSKLHGAICQAIEQAEQEPVAWQYAVTHNQDGTVSVALPDGDELRIILPNQQEPYCWTWDEFVSGGKWRAEYGWKKPERQVSNLQPLYTSPPQRHPMTDEQAMDAYCETPPFGTYKEAFIAGIRFIEAANGIKGEA